MQAWKIENRDTKAKFQSRCRNCRKPIEIGDDISLQHMEYQGFNALQVQVNNVYVHSECIVDIDTYN